MKHSVLETRLQKKINEVLPGAAPGLQLQVHQRGLKQCDIACGQTYPYYDLASLTKIIFTVPEMMKLFEEGKWTFSTRVKEVLPWFPSETVRITELLSHASGITWWKPYYQQMPLDAPIAAKWDKVKELLAQETFEDPPKTVYSDIGFWVLAHVIMALEQKPLLEVWKDLSNRIYAGLTSLAFHENNVAPGPLKHYAPTERCPWRGRLLQGEVHDDNAWSFGGVSSHAGLFGSIDDVAWYGLFLRSQMLGVSKNPFKLKTAKMFMTRQKPVGEGDFALGFMTRSIAGASSGDYFGMNSIGHTGFTGTSVWFDPDADLLVTILSNRVLLGRDREEFKKLRPQIHNWVVTELKRA